LVIIFFDKISVYSYYADNQLLGIEWEDDFTYTVNALNKCKDNTDIGGAILIKRGEKWICG
jgi:hypothetical protein